MSVGAIVAIVLVVLAALAILRRCVLWFLPRAAYRADMCGVCYAKTRDYEFDDGKGATFWVCESCATENIGAFTMPHMIKKGTLRRVG